RPSPPSPSTDRGVCVSIRCAVVRAAALSPRNFPPSLVTNGDGLCRNPLDSCPALLRVSLGWPADFRSLMEDDLNAIRDKSPYHAMTRKKANTKSMYNGF